MINKASRSEIREKKHRRLRHHLNGTATTPRLAVFRSNKHIYAQIIDDTVGKTLVSASTLQKDVKAELENTDDVQAAAKVGAVIGKKAVEAGIESVAKTPASPLQIMETVLPFFASSKASTQRSTSFFIGVVMNSFPAKYSFTRSTYTV